MVIYNVVNCGKPIYHACLNFGNLKFGIPKMCNVKNLSIESLKSCKFEDVKSGEFGNLKTSKIESVCFLKCRVSPCLGGG